MFKQLAVHNTGESEGNGAQSKEFPHRCHEGPDTEVAIVDFASAHSVVAEVNFNCPHRVKDVWKTKKKRSSQKKRFNQTSLGKSEKNNNDKQASMQRTSSMVNE